MKLHTINAGHFRLDGGAMFGVVPKSLWNKANPADDNNMCSWALRCLLIEHGNHRILVDTGMGSKQDEKFFSHYYMHGADTLDKSLAQHGFRPEDITDVLLTHLHFDHCGGAVKRTADGALAPAFPNAQYWTNTKHWQWAINPNDREKASFLKENLLPMEAAGVLRFTDVADGAEWMEDIRLRYVSGHTESMMLPQIRYNDTTILYCADLIPSVHHLPTAWVMAYDMQPLITLKEKKTLLTEAVANNWVLYFEHDPAIECCTLQQTEKGIRIKDIFRLSELETYRSSGRQ